MRSQFSFTHTKKEENQLRLIGSAKVLPFKGGSIKGNLYAVEIECFKPLSLHSCNT